MIKITKKENRPKIRVFKYLRSHFPPRFAFYPPRPLFVSTVWEYIKLSRWFIYVFMMVRAFYFLAKKGFKFQQIDIQQSSRHNSLVIAHNLWADLNVFNFSRQRIEFLIYILRIVPANFDGKTLSIGPKNEGELILLAMHGFASENIIGIDLFSYSPKILVMDVHCMNFPDNSFDTITCGWMLTYCYDIEKAIREIIRVAKNGALVACGFSIPPPVEQSDAINKVSRLRGGVNELLHLFGNAVHIIYWRRESGGRASVVFRIEK